MIADLIIAAFRDVHGKDHLTPQFGALRVVFTDPLTCAEPHPSPKLPTNMAILERGKRQAISFSEMFNDNCHPMNFNLILFFITAMKPSLRFFILIVVLALFLDQRALASSTSSPHLESVEMLSPTPTPTITLPTQTDQTCIAPTATVSPSGAEGEQETFKYIKQCITVEEKLPADVHPQDELLLYDDELNRERVHDFKVGYDRRSPYPLRHLVSDFVSSPDRKWMAYTTKGYTVTTKRRDFYSGYFYYYDDYYKLSSLTLEVQNAEGRKLDMSYWMVDWQYILGWMDNQHLILSISKYPAGSVVILNPFTGKWKVLSPSLPRIGEPEPYWKGLYPYYLAYNPLLTHVLYLPEDEENDQNRGSWTLYEPATQKVLWTGGDSMWNYSEPVWSPTGSHFVIIDQSNRDLNKALLIGKDGSVLTIASGVRMSYGKSLSWSPDGQRIAIWLGHTEDQSSLAIVDIEAQTVTDLCLQADNYWWNQSVLWSPDGQFIAVEIQDADDRSSDVVLVETRTKRAYRFRENASPIDWMKKP